MLGDCCKGSDGGEPDIVEIVVRGLDVCEGDGGEEPRVRPFHKTLQVVDGYYGFGMTARQFAYGLDSFDEPKDELDHLKDFGHFETVRVLTGEGWEVMEREEYSARCIGRVGEMVPLENDREVARLRVIEGQSWPELVYKIQGDHVAWRVFGEFKLPRCGVRSLSSF